MRLPGRLPPTTLFANGMGQDSAAILALLLEDPAFRQRYAPGRLLMLMSATGDEYRETDLYRERVATLCRDRDVEFVHITPEMGFHPRTWPSLHAQWNRNQNIGSVRYKSTCSYQLKVQTQKTYLNHHLAVTYGYPERLPRQKYAALLRYAEEYGRVRMLVGFSAGEERRVKAQTDPLMDRATVRIYPLIERGLTRTGCQDATRALGHEVPMPSNCRNCHWASPPELLRLARTDPESYRLWVNFERAKLDAPKWQGTANATVFGTRTIPEVLERAEKNHGHLSTEELDLLRFSRGHANRNGF